MMRRYQTVARALDTPVVTHLVQWIAGASYARRFFLGFALTAALIWASSANAKVELARAQSGEWQLAGPGWLDEARLRDGSSGAGGSSRQHRCLQTDDLTE